MWERVGGSHKDSQFFRFCSPVNVFSPEFEDFELSFSGEHGSFKREIAIVKGIGFIDYDLSAYIKESFLVMHYTKGGLSIDELDHIPFDEFRMWVGEAVRIQNMILKNQNGEETQPE
jgi:hypothetical protein